MTESQRQVLREMIDAAKRRKLSRPTREVLADLSTERPRCGAYGRWSNAPCRNRARPGSGYCGWHEPAERPVDPSLIAAVMRDVGSALASSDLIGLERSESPLHSTEQTVPGEPREGVSRAHAADTSCKSPLSAPVPRLSLVDPASGIQGSTTVETASDGAEAAL